MSNLIQRIIMFVLFVPGLLFLILGVPQSKHLALQIMVIFVAGGLAIEVGRIYNLWPFRAGDKTILLRTRILSSLAIIACGTIPLIVRMLVTYHLLPNEFVIISFVAPIAWIFSSQVVQTQTMELDQFMKRIQGYLMILIYPAMGLSFLLALISLTDSSILLLIFMGSVFMNDTFAYLAGRFLGKKSARPVRISPNKTVVGFIFGFLASVGVLFLAWKFSPDLFPGSWPAVTVLGILMGFSTILGDLFESGLKRASGLKDSGTVILGRGGLLDSVDSLIFSAPIFYYAYILLNNLTFPQ